MLQPFELFKQLYIQRLITLKKIYVVTQTYPEGFDPLAEVHKIDILLTDYDDIGLANIHKAAVKNDKYAAVLNLLNEKHLQKLNEMLSAESPYKLYWSVLRDTASLMKKLNLKYKDNMRRYVMKNTTWRIGGDEHLNPQLSVIFGELFIFLKRGAQELRVKFREIEKS